MNPRIKTPYYQRGRSAHNLVQWHPMLGYNSLSVSGTCKLKSAWSRVQWFLKPRQRKLARIVTRTLSHDYAYKQTWVLGTKIGQKVSFTQFSMSLCFPISSKYTLCYSPDYTLSSRICFDMISSKLRKPLGGQINK